MIIFVGDKPSAKNLSPDVPFVGTQSGVKLDGWIEYLELSEGDYDVININTDEGFDIVQEAESRFIAYKFVILGNKAEATLKKHFGMIYADSNWWFKLPHPSGLNRKLNDEKFVKNELNKCKEWLNER